MSEASAKTFDCVQTMRRIRDRLSEEVSRMTFEEQVRWLRSHRYADPLLRGLVERAAQQGDAAADDATGGISSIKPNRRNTDK